MRGGEHEARSVKETYNEERRVQVDDSGMIERTMV